MNNELNIREAVAVEAEVCSEILCNSIVRLCSDDHGDNREIVNRWISNKTPENLRKWIESTGSTIYVAELNEVLVAVGGIDDRAEITLNYVVPEYRFCGVSRKMLEELESVLRIRGVKSASLTSTETAHRFYLSAGWRDVADFEIWMGMKIFPMVKSLSM